MLEDILCEIMLCDTYIYRVNLSIWNQSQKKYFKTKKSQEMPFFVIKRKKIFEQKNIFKLLDSYICLVENFFRSCVPKGAVNGCPKSILHKMFVFDCVVLRKIMGAKKGIANCYTNVLCFIWSAVSKLILEDAATLLQGQKSRRFEA